MKIVDLRPQDSRDREQLAQRSLGWADERVAKKLAKISKKLLKEEIKAQETYPSEFTPISEEIRRIGESLCKNGGTERMDLVCYRVQVVAGTSYFVRRNWDGICGWEY